MRHALGVEYDGRDFHGWESQRGQRTVQACVEAALSSVADHPVAVVCAGRTDAGVHAVGQTLHFDSTATRDQRAWILGANSKLPDDVAIVWQQTVDSSFHARYSALRRHYRYTLLTRAVRSPLLRGHAAWRHRALDVERMTAAAEHLVGEHDFSAFRAAGCQARNPVRTVSRVEVRGHRDLVTVDVTANAFLYHMVRNIVGVLMAVGEARRPPEWARVVLESRDRTRGGVTAPPGGLCLMSVDYPEAAGLPAVSPERSLW